CLEGSELRLELVAAHAAALLRIVEDLLHLAGDGGLGLGGLDLLLHPPELVEGARPALCPERGRTPALTRLRDAHRDRPLARLELLEPRLHPLELALHLQGRAALLRPARLGPVALQNHPLLLDQGLARER